MSAILKLVARAGYLGVTGDEIEKVYTTVDKMGLCVPAGKIIRVGGKLDGEAIDDGIIEANQTVVIFPGVTINPRKYNVITSYNAALAKAGAQVTVGAPVIGAHEGEDVFLTVRTLKKLDISDLDYMFRFYVID